MATKVHSHSKAEPEPKSDSFLAAGNPGSLDGLPPVERAEEPLTNIVPRNQPTELILEANDAPSSAGGTLILANVNAPQIQEILIQHRHAVHAERVASLHRIAAGLALAPLWKSLPHGDRDAWIKSLQSDLCRRTIQRYMAESTKVWPKIQERAALLLDIPATDQASITPEFLLALDRRNEVVALLEAEKSETKKPSNSLDAKLHWRTPESLVTAIEKYLGHISYDVTAEMKGPFRVPADHHLSLKQNGLRQKWLWEGNVYACPPWNEELSHWVHRAQADVTAGRVQEAVLLLPALVDAPWARVIAGYPRAFLRERLPVELPDGETYGKLRHAAMIVAVAAEPRLQAFAECFKQVADIFVPFKF